jgi:hypothetical protein
MKGLSHIPEIVIWPFTACSVVKHGSGLNKTYNLIEEYKMLGLS